MPSFYQSDLFREIAARDDVELEVIYAHDLSLDRIELGWQNDLQGFSHRFLSRISPMREALSLAWQQRDRLHIINGLWAEPTFMAALITFMLARARYVIYMESPNPTIKRSNLKRFAQKVFGRIALRRATGVLPISKLASKFFEQHGAQANLSYPFGYFRAHQPTGSSDDGAPFIGSGRTPEQEKDIVEIVFVGQLIHRKGLDVLLDAIEPLFAVYPQLRLALIGEGELRDSLAKRIKDSGLATRVALVGMIASNEILARLSGADLLVLPSRWDGWGLVVNEAFAVGIPVIVSDACGAADLVRSGVNGYVFRNEDAADLRACVNNFLSRQDEWEEFRRQSDATGKRISTARMSSYLIAALKHMIGQLKDRPDLSWNGGAHTDNISRDSDYRVLI